MKRSTSLVVLSTLFFTIQTSAQAADDAGASLTGLQGAWWSDCEAPAAEFVISGNEYSGDFEGSYEVTLTGDVLMFSEGFGDGHSVNVSHEPLAFQILERTGEKLVLRPLSDSRAGSDWILQTCE